jgi:hypothetical protein
MSGDEMEPVHGPMLPDTIHTSDSLLQPHRIPRQLQIDDDTTGVMKIQPLPSGVGREKDRSILGESFEDCDPFVPRHPAV